MTRLLIVEDEEITREELRKLLRRKGWEVEVAGTVPEAKRKLAAGRFEIVLADVRLPGALGTALLRGSGDARVVMMSAYGSVDSAVDAMKLGAVDYVTKPINQDDLLERLERATPRGDSAVVERKLLGESAPMLKVRDCVRRVARTDLSVLVIGESGTGKELVARAIHQQSARSKGPFVAFNCAAFTDTLVDSELFGHEAAAFTGARAHTGLFEAANGGTVFLDEVGELPATTQARLLRVLQEREVRRVGGTDPRRIDVRIVSATNRDLPAAARAGKFRDDLLFRLRGVKICLPPLRERQEDLFLLARRVLEEACSRQGRPQVTLSEAACRAMREHPWPGNVRELENTLQCALLFCDDGEIDAPHLSFEDDALVEAPRRTSIDTGSLTVNDLKASRQKYILANRDRLSKNQIALDLGISRTTLWRVWPGDDAPIASK